MTLGELADLLQELKTAEQEVEDAKLSLRHGGNADTMERKRMMLDYCEGVLDRMRDTPLTFTEENQP